MELKKNPEYDAKTYTTTFFLGGLLIAGLVTLGAFTYTQYPTVEAPKEQVVVNTDMEELPDITQQNEPPPPAPPPPPPATVEAVEDDADIEEADIASTEEDKPYVPTVAPPPPGPKGPEKTNEEEIFEFAEKMPEFKDGDIQTYIAKHLFYPPLAAENGKQGTVFVQFIVESNGTVSNVKVVKTFDEDCGNEAMKVVKTLKFQPGEQRGKPVRVKMGMPIKFRLQ
jgi:periplasmic protein TonB